ncbi:hypothetical protein BDW72DRAFT_184607 [Aspergillus terricola var. indicus]
MPYKQGKAKKAPATTGKRQEKVLLAETIGRTLCLRQTRLDRDNSCSERLHIPDPGQLFGSNSPASQWLSVPDQRLPGSATASSETLTTESRDSTLYNTSSAPSRSDRHTSTECNASRTRIVSLKGTATAQDAERLALEYGLPSQMGLLDPNYSIFINEQKSGGVCFKVLNKVAVVLGDPLCHSTQIPSLMADFKLYRRQKRWGVSVLGAGKELVEYSAYTEEGTSTIVQFGHNRVLNPLTNEVIHETSGKRILTQNRQLLNPSKGGISLDIYTPSVHGTDYKLEWELSSIYHDWCIARNATEKPQAFITEYDPFLMPTLMTYIYARNSHGTVLGFAALRWVGMKGGYHVDPCIAGPGARKGITDLLLFASMAYLRQQGVSYLSVGYEPSESLAGISGLPGPLAPLTDRLYQFTFHRLPISGKRAYFDKFRPDDAQCEPVYLIFSSKLPRPRDVVAVAHAANIKLRRLVFHGSPES